MQTGDFVIFHEPRAHRRRAYLVYRVRRQFLVFYESYDDAVARVQRLAPACRVDAWYTSDDEAFIQIFSGRQPTH